MIRTNLFILTLVLCAARPGQAEMVLLDLYNGGSIASFNPFGDATLTDEGGFMRLSVLNDSDNSGRVFGGLTAPVSPTYDFTPTNKRLRIEHRVTSNNKQSTMVAALWDDDGSSREKHEFNFPVPSSAFQVTYVDISQPASFVFQPEDGIANYGLEEWVLQSRFGEGALTNPNRAFEIDIRSVRLVAVPEPSSALMLTVALVAGIFRRRLTFCSFSNIATN